MEQQGFYSTNNNIISSFYNENPNINFEEANLLMINIFKLVNNSKTNISYENINTLPLELEKNVILNKGKIGEDTLEIILNKINPSANVILNNDNEYMYDFMIMRENKPKIIIENKEVNINIKTNQIELFSENCRKLNCNGIFISQNSGIINKYNYQIDIIDKNIIVYIHFANYDYEKIKIAFDIIDNVHEKIYYTKMSNEIGITKDLLNEINQEFQFFIKQKDELKHYIKDTQNKLLNQLDDVKFNKLNNYLSCNFTSNVKVGIHKCNLCNFYTSNTLKGMAAHKRGCKKKYKNNA
jgi:hypothetical protein